MATRAEAAAAQRPASLAGRPGGWRIVAGKEIADSVTSARFVVLIVILGLAAAVPVYFASGDIRNVGTQASGAPAVFLALFTVGHSPLPAFYSLVGFLSPLLGIAFGFDAVNGERAQGTLPRLLAQPIYRDDVINGKFVAGLTVIGTIVVAMTALVAGIGLLRLGIVPTFGEVERLLVWLVLTIVYIGLWLAFATLCSVVFSRAATSAMVALGVWLALTLFGSLFANLVANLIAPLPASPTIDQSVANAQAVQLLSSLSPSSLYQQATLVVLDPGVTALGVSGTAQLLQLAQQAPTLLSLEQSLLVAWPQMVVMVALMVVSFAGAYLGFLRQEVRA
jgi:ABC-2 type transport system permease protein